MVVQVVPSPPTSVCWCIVGTFFFSPRRTVACETVKIYYSRDCHLIKVIGAFAKLLNYTILGIVT
jgi:hypothetical protein